MRHLLLLPLLPLAFSGCAPTPEPMSIPGASSAAGIEWDALDAQHRRFAAMVRGDVEALREMLADELVYTHTTGVVEGKAAFLEALRTAAVRYDEVVADDVRVQKYPGVAVVTGSARMRVAAGGRELAFVARFTEVQAHRDGAWRLVAWQSTRVSE